MIVRIASSVRDSRRVPADEQCLDIVARIECGEVVFGGGHFGQVALEIAARIGVHAACARMDVNVNGPHKASVARRSHPPMD